MSKGNTTIASVKETSTLVRPMFGPGMLLQHEDLEQLNVYTRELSRLMFRSLFGCGVVCGLVVTPPVEECGKVYVTVGAGLALNCSGDPVYVPKDQRFAIDENCDPKIKRPLWVVLCGATKNCAPRTAMCTDDDDKTTSVCTRERDMFEIRVVSERPKCVCGCGEPKEYQKAEGSKDHCLCADPIPDCYKDHYAGKCGCKCGDGSDCGCECILLARLDKAESKWTADHRVRRFIRPVLMRDPQVEIEQQAPRDPKKKAQQAVDVAGAEAEMRVAYKFAADAAEAADKATGKANEAAAVQAVKLAAAQTAAEQVTKAKAVANKAKAAADKAKAPADKAAPGDKTAADKAAADADKAAKLAKDVAAEADKAVALSKEAAAEAEKATTEASAAEAARLKAVEDKIAADRVLAAAADKAATLAAE